MLGLDLLQSVLLGSLTLRLFPDLILVVNDFAVAGVGIVGTALAWATAPYRHSAMSELIAPSVWRAGYAGGWGLLAVSVPLTLTVANLVAIISRL